MAQPCSKTSARSSALRSALVQCLRRFLEEQGTRIPTLADRSFETEGEAIESGFRRTLESRDTVVRSLVRAAYRFRDCCADRRKEG
jgi:hypothetical protein